ncbi:energy transducer TonB [Massilia sp. W12]|uniref:energy transducer TonB n=1 Tax=Massilia sp. W12 TaxID=3126507 RepID=UPI0030D23730
MKLNKTYALLLALCLHCAPVQAVSKPAKALPPPYNTVPLLVRCDFTYPTKAAREGAEGTVQLYVKVNRIGLVEEAVVYRSSGYRYLDYPARDFALETCVFTPGLHNGVAVSKWTILTVQWELD